MSRLLALMSKPKIRLFPLGKLRDEGRVMLVSTHNLGSVPEFATGRF